MFNDTRCLKLIFDFNNEGMLIKYNVIKNV